MTPSPPPTNDGRSAAPRGAAFLLAQVGAHAATRFGERLAELGLTPPEAGLLRLIATQPGRSQQSLAEALAVVPSRVVALIDNLERKGLAERRRNTTDRRHYALHLTAKATQLMRDIRRIAGEHEDDIFAALDGTQRARMITLLELIATQQGLAPGVHPGYRQLPQ